MATGNGYWQVWHHSRGALFLVIMSWKSDILLLQLSRKKGGAVGACTARKREMGGSR
jgi:hypothetical protein